MAELLDRLWPAFIAETSEHLRDIEKLLLQDNVGDKAHIDNLFRAFHTVKGSCAMVGFSHMEHLAHVSEDILSLVRNGAVELTAPLRSLLLSSMDTLNRQFIDASESRENPPEDKVLLEKLDRFLAKNTQNPANVPERKPEIPVKSSADIENFEKHLQVALPALILSIDADVNPAQVAKSLKPLKRIAEQNGWQAMATGIEHLLGVFQSRDLKALPLESISNLFEDIHVVEQQQQIHFNLNTTRMLSRSRLGKRYLEQLVLLTDTVDQLQHTAETGWTQSRLQACILQMQQLSVLAGLQQMHALKPVWRYGKQLFLEIMRGELLFDKQLMGQWLTLLSLAREPSDDENFHALCREKLDVFRKEVTTANNSRSEIQAIRKDILLHSSLTEGALSDIKIEDLERLQAGIANKASAFEIDLDFSNEQASERVLKALGQVGEIVHSRTLFHDFVNGTAQRTSFSFLILTDKTREDTDRILGIMDQGSNCYRFIDPLPDDKGAATSSEAPSPDTDSMPTTEASDQDETEQLAKETRLALGSLKVDGKVIDSLIADTGEAINSHNRLRFLLESDVIDQALARLSDQPSASEAINTLATRFEQIREEHRRLKTELDGLQKSILNLRVVPIAYVFDRFPSLIRKTCEKLKKSVDLHLSGGDITIDKGMIDVLSEPLGHIIRNSIDHGIEQATVRENLGKPLKGQILLDAMEKNGAIIITIRDDGAGLDTEGIRKKSIELGLITEDETDTSAIHGCIFKPGFSTAEKLSETSGRGVGMDVVRTRILEAGGNISLSSTEGTGTTIQLTLPVSAALQSVLLIDHKHQTLAIPERQVVEIIPCGIDDLINDKSRKLFMLRNNPVPVFHVGQIFSQHEQPFPLDTNELIILTNGIDQVGLLIETTRGRVEVLIRDNQDVLTQLPGVLNASVLGNGQVVIIVDCTSLFQAVTSRGRNINFIG